MDGNDTVKLWDVQTGKLLHTATTSALKFHYTAEGQWLIIYGFNKIEIRNAKTLALVQTYENNGYFTDLNFTPPITPDGKYEIYPYYLSFFVKEAKPSLQNKLISAVSRPTITWETPNTERITVSQSTFTVKACVQGTGVSQYNLVHNRQSLSNRSIKIASCPLAVEQTVTLQAGLNEFYITATNEGGTSTSERRYITYQPAQSTTPSMASATTTQKRLALVIGNARYTHAGTLANPVNDAEAIRQVLKESGFEVLFYTNLDKKGMVAAIQEFGQKLKDYNVGLCYYAGHGTFLNGTNYFLPVDANPRSADEVEFEGLPTTRLIRKMEETNRQTNILLFDACRNNPFERSWGRTLGETGGFALLPPPKGTLIAYAASEGEQAADAGRNQTNSPFAAAFVKYVRQGGLSLSQILLRVRREVEEVTKERQTTQEVNMLRDDFYFK
ncbi:hypothetical protein GCM10023187_52800 [Nibrella viscosa]|uniref:Caspase family p20 domain-containing protein n=1 Tax=Nibrella viscosa TaxID=1084524 RepID=A0ABP8KXZ0_9BACT